MELVDYPYLELHMRLRSCGLPMMHQPFTARGCLNSYKCAGGVFIIEEVHII